VWRYPRGGVLSSNILKDRASGTASSKNGEASVGETKSQLRARFASKKRK
jgi:hypothetical protein